jgi:hypothetical protein
MPMAKMPMFSFFWFIHHAAPHMNTMATMNMQISSRGLLGHGTQSPSTLSITAQESNNAHAEE